VHVQLGLHEQELLVQEVQGTLVTRAP
jgi:hypothetical protein